ncbi:MAG: response regulator [Clostridia bacterium]|nr:response regulator [Clostridia bacterium]
MLRILVVDDEEIIRKGLIKALKKVQDFEVVGDAADGKAAIALIESAEPDVVITDIKMPRMDGRELVKYLEDNHPEIKKIVLSGFEDYNYVRDTMKNGAVDYLLKPIDDEKLFYILKEIEASIQAENKRREDKLSMKIKLNESLPLLKEQFITEILCSNKYSEEEIQKKLTYYNICMTPGQFNTILISIENLKLMIKEKGTEESRLKTFIVRNIAEETISQYTTFFSCVQNFGIAIIISLKNESQLENITNEIFRNLSCYADTRFTISIGSTIENLCDLRKSYENALRILSLRFYSEKSSTLSKKDLNGTTLLVSDEDELHAIFEKAASHLKSSIEVIKTDEVKAAFNELHNTVKKLRFNPQDVMKMITNLYNKLLLAFADFERAAVEVYGFDYCYPKEIEMFDTLDELIQYSTKVYSDIIEKISALRNKKDKKIVEVVKEYVSKHYNEDITLSKVAEIAYVNPNYFCDMFKSQTGENFIDYLTKIRIEKAKALLKDIRIKTYEVGELVGYEDPTYFSKVFKKVVGITPTQYRNIVL